MAGLQNWIEWVEDFIGAMVLGTSAAEGSPWVVADTSAAGSPTYAVSEPSNGGEAALTLDSTSEVQNVCLHFGDNLCFDIDKLVEIEFAVKTEAALDAAVDICFGLWGDRNDDPDSVAQHAHFRLDGSNDVVVESDDGTNDNDDVSTGKTLDDSYKRFLISFAAGTNDVRFEIDGVRVAKGTTFDMSNYTGSLQPVVQIQKTADTAADSVTVDYVRVLCKRFDT